MIEIVRYEDIDVFGLVQSIFVWKYKISGFWNIGWKNLG